MVGSKGTLDDDLLFGEGCPQLLGASPRERVVGVAVQAGKAYVWQRPAAGQTTLSVESFRPYLWLHSGGISELLACASQEQFTCTELSGQGFYNRIISAANEKELAQLSKEITKASGVALGSNSSWQMYSTDYVNLFLSKAGFCLFRGLNFSEVLRLNLTVSCKGGEWKDLRLYTEQPVEAIAVSMSGQKKLLSIESYKNEAELLRDFVKLVEDWDPDIIEGHGLYDDILSYLQARAKANRVKLSLGRGLPQGEDSGDKVGSKRKSTVVLEPVGRSTHLTIANKRYDYISWQLWGRELVDTVHLARLHDVSSRELETFELEEIAQSLGLLQEVPPLTDPTKNIEFWNDVLARTADTLLYPYFIQVQLLPYSLQNTTLRGTATKINALFLREYLRQGAAVPSKTEASAYGGAACGQELAGLVKNVLHCDVQSLYPSLMLTFGLEPKNDYLHIFLDMLARLRDFRLQAKAKMREEAACPSVDRAKLRFYEALQNTFKILINSFYGYLGFSQGNFADFSCASQVTAKGREILEFILQFLKDKGCHIVEFDTDGVYFTAPEELASDPQKRLELAEALNQALPQGIGVELDGFYPAMYSHSIKNYALLDSSGQISFSGATFRSRSREEYLRTALQEMVSLLLTGRKNDIAVYLHELKERIIKHEIPIKQLGKTEILNDSLENYSRKIERSTRSRAAAYEVALKASHPYRAGQAVSYYITGSKKNVRAFEMAKSLELYDPQEPDENTAYYVSKLEALVKQFSILSDCAAQQMS